MIPVASLALKIVTAHLVGDYVFQTEWVAEHKRRGSVLALHALGHAVLLALVAVTEPRDSRLLLALGLLLVAHVLIDAWTSRRKREGAAPLVLDQLLHAATLAAAIAIARPAEGTVLVAAAAAGLRSGRALVLVAGFIASVWMGAVVVGRVVQPFAPHIADDPAGARPGLKNAGRVIGIIERGLIFLSILAGLESLVGFVVAAKALLRLPGARDPRSRELSEYYLVGTLASVFWAVMIGLATRALVRGMP